MDQAIVESIGTGLQAIGAGLGKVMDHVPLASLGAGLCAIGAGLGIGWLWSAGIQSMARQPELAPKIQITMFIGAALVEGLALFGLVICFLQM